MRSHIRGFSPTGRVCGSRGSSDSDRHRESGSGWADGKDERRGEGRGEGRRCSRREEAPLAPPLLSSRQSIRGATSNGGEGGPVDGALRLDAGRHDCRR
ncbi:hypothetical protein NL676_027926 [Syzygium grande]|nr:hypothetical protein NL676_027926 [Syzygium grande]